MGDNNQETRALHLLAALLIIGIVIGVFVNAYKVIQHGQEAVVDSHTKTIEDYNSSIRSK